MACTEAPRHDRFRHGRGARVAAQVVRPHPAFRQHLFSGTQNAPAGLFLAIHLQQIDRRQQQRQRIGPVDADRFAAAAVKRLEHLDAVARY